MVLGGAIENLVSLPLMMLKPRARCEASLVESWLSPGVCSSASFSPTLLGLATAAIESSKSCLVV